MKKILLPIILITSSIFATSSSTSHIYWNVNDKFISLEQAPLLSSNVTSNNKLSLPTPNGDMKEFYIYQSPVMPLLLSEKFPNIKTFTGVGIDNPSDRASIAINGSSIRAMILSVEGNIFISSLEQGNLFRVSFEEFDQYYLGTHNH